MNFKDNTIILKDKSIVVFFDNGNVELYPSSKWKKPRKDNCHKFSFESKTQAIEIFTLIENQI